MKLKKIIALMTLMSMMATGMSSAVSAEESVKDALKEQMVECALTTVGSGEADEADAMKIYSNIRQASHADTLPAKLDLRDRGIVPEIQNQGNFGTCWGFASIAASEISILSDLGMTAQEFRETYGKDFKLSERHLAWFSSMPIQEMEGMSEHELAQVGEGRTMFEEDGKAISHLGLGGFMGYAASMFAAGIGPVTAELVPYCGNDGSPSTASDWSVDESMRFAASFELKDSSILPSPAGRDADGNYEYNEIATEMIKQELLEGRAVSFAYHADQAMDPDASKNSISDELAAKGADRSMIETFFKVRYGEIAQEDLSEEESIGFMKILYMLYTNTPYADIPYETPEELALAVKQAEADLGIEESADSQVEEVVEVDDSDARAVAEKLSLDYDEFVENIIRQNEAGKEVYMNIETSAQYCWTMDAPANHAVVIVGYDDNFPASNFLEGHQPPADGAWIVRNSWGPGYGTDGYFYLSYYDQTICEPETFAYVIDEDSRNTTSIMIDEYDFMQIASINNGVSKEPIYMANEFTMESDAVLTYVSCMTSNLNTNVTAAVYLLDENSQNPTDGELLDVCTTDFKYSGYHRIPLSQHYKLPKGSRISVVETHRYDDEDGRYYVIPYGTDLNRAWSEDYNTMMQYVPEGRLMDNSMESRIGRGESFVCADGTWMDWVDLIDEVKESSPLAAEYVSYDNLPIKAYYYMLSDIEGQHTFGEPIPYANGEIQLCTDCGYALVER